MIRRLFAVSLLVVVISMILQSLGERVLSFILLALGGMVSSGCFVVLLEEHLD
jgi:hypothetical protein